jgi:alpha-glucosidase
MMALYEAPLQMLCDSPTKYEKNMACFAFMAATPVVWQDTVGLGGCPESYAAVARQAPDGAWYVAAIGNAKAHDVTIDTARFLAAGDWRVEIFRDDVSAASAQAYLHETRTLKAGEKMTVPMACGGGFVMKFAK